MKALKLQLARLLGMGLGALLILGLLAIKLAFIGAVVWVVVSVLRMMGVL